MTIIDPHIPGIRILEETDCPADGVMFQNLWDSAIVGMNWTFRSEGTSATSGSDDLDQFLLSPGEIAVAVPHQMIVVDRPQKAERRLWSETQHITADYVEFLLRTQRRTMEKAAETQPSVSEQWHERTAAKLRNAYERLGVPSESVPSVGELKGQLAEGHLQAEHRRRVKFIPDEIRLSWVLFEDGLFYGPTRTAHCLLLLWSFSRKVRSMTTEAQSTDLDAEHPLAAEFAEVRRRTASGPDELAHLVDRLPESDRQIIREIKPILGNETDSGS